MPAPQDHPFVTVFAGIILGSDADWPHLCESMARLWGPLDLLSEPMPFDMTDYYQREMGRDLVRRLVSFEPLQCPSELPALKHQAMALEDAFRRADGGRTVNIDVGYIDLHRVVLASTKERPQKIYLQNGIWADMTLQFHSGCFHAFDWTFPDFADGRYDDYLTRVRDRYKVARRERLAATEKSGT